MKFRAGCPIHSAAFAEWMGYHNLISSKPIYFCVRAGAWLSLLGGTIPFMRK